MRHRGDQWGAGLGAVVYLAAVAGAWRASEPQPFGDTYRYFGSALWDIQNPGVTPVLVYTLVEDPTRVVLLQVVVNAVAWLALAGAAWWRLQGTWVRWGLPVLVLASSLTAPLWSWNTLLGSESFTNSAAVLWLASLVWVAGSRSPAPAILSNAAASALLLFTRPALVPVVLAVQCMVAIWAWRNRPARGSTLVGLSAVAALSAYAVVRLQLLASSPTYRYRYAIDNYVDKTTSFRAYADASMPRCEPLAAAVNGPRPWDDVWQIKEQLTSLCPEAFLWLRGPRSSFLSWAGEIPLETLANGYGALRSLAFIPYTQARALPEGIDSVIAPLAYPWLILLASLVLGVVLAAAAGVRLRLTWRLLLGALAVVGATLGTMLLIWGADGIEHYRHLMPLPALLPVAGLVLPATLPTRRARPWRSPVAPGGGRAEG